MADRAQVTSVEALEAFRSALVIYLSKARPALEEMANEVARAKQWLQNDQRSGRQVRSPASRARCRYPLC